MTVKEIITNVAYLLDDRNLTIAIENNTFSGQNTEKRNLLVKCVNYINDVIATEYFPIIGVKQLTTTSNLVPYSTISNNTIYDIVEVRDSFGYKTPFKVTNAGLETVKGKITIKYCYLPEEVDYNSELTTCPIKITDRVFAYAVASEYCFIKGNYDDGEIWDKRFKDAIQVIQRPRKSVIMPKRRWK